MTASMIIDFIGCYLIEQVCKALFADLEPKELVTRGRERREKRRAVEALETAKKALEEIKVKKEE